MDAGLYIAVFWLPRRREIEVGRLGRCVFRRGFYLYVGSAQRNLRARLARHARKGKPLRWHIDYFSVRAEMIGAMVVPGPKAAECALARQLAKFCEEPVPGFGSSDCRCRSHLFYLERWGDI